MYIDHVALYVRELAGMKRFYEQYFNASAGAFYHNPNTGLQTVFLSFSAGCRLELMTRPGLTALPAAAFPLGYGHLALVVGDRAAVDALTERLRTDGYTVTSGPRVTGDGYYESCVLDPEGNQIELTADA